MYCYCAADWCTHLGVLYRCCCWLHPHCIYYTTAADYTHPACCTYHRVQAIPTISCTARRLLLIAVPAAPYCCTLLPRVTAQPTGEDDWRKIAPTFVVAIKSMTTEALLECLVSLNVSAAKHLQVERAEQQEMQAGRKKAIAAAAIYGRTNEGRRTLQTRLTTAA